MKIESKTVEVPQTAENIFNYLTDLNNFKDLLPAERISDWESTKEYCSFKVQNTATIDLKLAETDKPGKIILRNGDKSPFPLELNVFISDEGESCKVYQICDAKVNPFLKMMVEKPLRNLFDYIADRLVEVNK